MHKTPLTPLEEGGLQAHGLDIGKPSQLSDAFRQGVAWAIEQRQGDPVAWLYRDPDGNARDCLELDRATEEERGGWLEIPLYAHADPGGVAK